MEMYEVQLSMLKNKLNELQQELTQIPSSSKLQETVCTYFKYTHKCLKRLQIIIFITYYSDKRTGIKIIRNKKTESDIICKL